LVALVRDLEKIARSRQAVLLLGETGVGKEVVARSVHDRSQRSGAFCAVDCGAVPESLFEGTFFGHRRGAFTGAAEARTGEIVRAHGGTLFLDEVSNMSLACQAKLLRVLEEGKVTALGASEAQVVDVRWIAATNADPFARGAAFRPDLLQRLASFIARLPPLRRRREDLGALAAHFLSEAGARKASITAAGARRLFGDPFEGNVRQLRSMLQTAVLLAADSPIDLAHLPVPGETDDGEALEEASRDDGPRLRQTSAPLGQGPTAAPDVATLESALEKTGGNVIRAAEALDVRPRQLYRWIARFGLPLDKYRGSK
jgi:DNA-binding NtrC family response regulator